MSLLDAQSLVIENLEDLEGKLQQAVDLGFIDEEETYYNILSTLIEDAQIVKSWDELAEVIFRAKTLEEDIDTWLSLKGYTTIGLHWPEKL